MAYNRSKEEEYIPTELELYTKLTVKNLLWLYGQFDWPQSSELVEAYTKDKFSKREGERWVALLFLRIDNLNEETRNEVLNGTSSKSIRLKSWYDSHVANDEI